MLDFGGQMHWRVAVFLCCKAVFSLSFIVFFRVFFFLVAGSRHWLWVLVFCVHFAVNLTFVV